jgi:type II secretory pathway component PulM
MELNHKQKITAIISLSIVLVIALIIMFIKPVFDTNNTLHTQFNSQQKLTNYLAQIKQTIKNDKVLPSLSQDEARKLINNKLNVVKSVKIRNNKIIVSIKKQNFNKIINSLYKLKTNYGIVVVSADITKVAEGLVDASLTFSHL